MGHTLEDASANAFAEELEKLALGTGLLEKMKGFLGKNPLKTIARGHSFSIRRGPGDLEVAARRISSPFKGLAEGWRESSPLPALQRRAESWGYKTPQDMMAAIKSSPEFIADPKTMAKAKKKLLGQWAPGFGGGEHLLGPDPTAGKIRGTAEALSRAGWTGAGSVSKYLPVGMKSWAAIPTAMAIPELAKANNTGPTGEGGSTENLLREVGSAGGMIMGTGLGVLPGIGMFMGGSALGSRLGRVIDRVRAGANSRQALFAPSPQEAMEQMENVQTYYG